MLEKKIKKIKYYVRPKRAWEQMKAAWTARQTVYLYGVTGTGKTSFAADFLDRKRYYYVSMSDTGIDEAAREIQERLDNLREKTERIIFVIDDLYLLETQEERNTCEKLIEKLCVRRDVWLVLISRAPMPEWLTSVYIRYIFVADCHSGSCRTYPCVTRRIVYRILNITIFHKICNLFYCHDCAVIL